MQQTKERELTIIEQVHQDFYSAEDRLLHEAKAILAKPAADEGKAERVRQLGFGQAKPSRQLRELATERTKALELQQQVGYYRKVYPLHKFITEEEVQALCKKWGLVLGDASHYIGDIPEKNIAEMEAFKVKKSDLDDEVSLMRGGINEILFAMLDHPRRMGMISEISFDPGGLDAFRHGILAAPSLGVKFSGPEGREIFGRAQRSVDNRQSPSFKIVAPVSDFDITGYAVAGGYKLEQKIEDPIVLQPVKGGYLIVTAWGPEASDPIVVHSINN